MKDWLTENTSYKVVAFLVASVLWLTMLGRKESVLTRDFHLQFLLASNQTITNQIRQKVRVEVSGPRGGLKKFSEGQEEYTVDLTNLPPGRQIVHLSGEGLNTPVGVKLLSIYPEEIVVHIKEGEPPEGSDRGKKQ